MTAKLLELQGKGKVRDACLFLRASDRDSAFQLLEEAYQQRVFRIIELTMPMFDGLRSDSRWQDLVHRIGLLQ